MKISMIRGVSFVATSFSLFFFFQNCGRSASSSNSESDGTSESALRNPSPVTTTGDVCQTDVPCKPSDLKSSFVLDNLIYLTTPKQFFAYSKNQSKFINFKDIDSNLKDRNLSTVWSADPYAPKNPAQITLTFQIGSTITFLDQTSWYVYSTTEKKFINPRLFAPQLSDNKLSTAWGNDPNAPHDYSNLTVSFNHKNHIIILDQTRWFAYNINSLKWVSPNEFAPGLANNLLSTVWGNDVNAPKNYADLKVSYQIGAYIYYLDSQFWYAFGIDEDKFMSPAEMGKANNLIKTAWNL